MLVLALDTATPAVTAGVGRLTGDRVQQLSARVAHHTRTHAELLMPGVRDAVADAGSTLRDLDAVVVGTGPGPFTGLRVGMVTAAALGDALQVPVHGVCTLDAIARDARPGLPDGVLLVVTDARRREVYWAGYRPDGRRVDGPHVEAPALLRDRLPALQAVAAAGAAAAETGLPVVEPAAPSPAARPALRSGRAAGPLEPLYLRRPDAVEPGPRKPVSLG